MALKIVGSGFSKIIGGINYAIKMGAKVSSHSYGASASQFYSKENVDKLQKILKNFQNILENNPKHIFVVGAGNDGMKVTNEKIKMGVMVCPCATQAANVICVGSSDKLAKKSKFSNYGKDFVHVLAPGSDITSAYYRSEDDYVTISGTR